MKIAFLFEIAFYLKKYPTSIPRQFHAVLSTKGTEHNAEELKTLAEQYIQQMGYSDNPYLIYFHKDTDNNHV